MSAEEQRRFLVLVNNDIRSMVTRRAHDTQYPSGTGSKENQDYNTQENSRANTQHNARNKPKKKFGDETLKDSKWAWEVQGQTLYLWT